MEHDSDTVFFSSKNISADDLVYLIEKLEICVQRTWMPPPSALSKMALWLRYWLLSDNCKSIQADLYNIEETMRDHVDQKDLHSVCSQT